MKKFPSHITIDDISNSTRIKPKNYLVGLEFPESNIDGDTSFSFGLQFVEDPSVFERTFTHFGGFLLEFFDGSLVDTTTFVDQVTGGGGLSGVNVSNDDDVDVGLCFSHDKVSDGSLKIEKIKGKSQFLRILYF